MKPVRFHAEAEAELLDAVAFYETRSAGLGRRFVLSIQEASGRLAANPDLYPVVEGDVRRCLAKTFPYALLFRAMDKCLVIVAVVHLHREPGYWKSR